MKLTLLATSLLLTFSVVLGQSIEIVDVNDMNTDISGTTVEVVGDKNDQTIYKDMRIVNTGDSEIIVKYKRIRDYSSGALDQICDNSLCYDADDSYTYTSPAPNPIASGDQSIFKPQIVPNGMESCAVNKYYVISDFGVIYDSITVVYRTTNAECNLSIKNENKKQEFNIFPNPAQNTINIKGESLKNGGTIVFLDALGKEVKRTLVNNVENNISISELKRGVYFVNIYSQDGVKSKVQRLVVQ